MGTTFDNESPLGACTACTSCTDSKLKKSHRKRNLRNAQSTLSPSKRSKRSSKAQNQRLLRHHESDKFSKAHSFAHKHDRIDKDDSSSDSSMNEHAYLPVATHSMRSSRDRHRERGRDKRRDRSKSRNSRGSRRSRSRRRSSSKRRSSKAKKKKHRHSVESSSSSDDMGTPRSSNLSVQRASSTKSSHKTTHVTIHHHHPGMRSLPPKQRDLAEFASLPVRQNSLSTPVKHYPDGTTIATGNIDTSASAFDVKSPVTSRTPIAEREKALAEAGFDEIPDTEDRRETLIVNSDVDTDDAMERPNKNEPIKEFITVDMYGVDDDDMMPETAPNDSKMFEFDSQAPDKVEFRQMIGVTEEMRQAHISREPTASPPPSMANSRANPAQMIFQSRTGMNSSGGGGGISSRITPTRSMDKKINATPNETKTEESAQNESKWAVKFKKNASESGTDESRSLKLDEVSRKLLELTEKQDDKSGNGTRNEDEEKMKELEDEPVIERPRASFRHARRGTEGTFSSSHSTPTPGMAMNVVSNRLNAVFDHPIPEEEGSEIDSDGSGKPIQLNMDFGSITNFKNNPSSSSSSGSSPVDGIRRNTVEYHGLLDHSGGIIDKSSRLERISENEYHPNDGLNSMMKDAKKDRSDRGGSENDDNDSQTSIGAFHHGENIRDSGIDTSDDERKSMEADAGSVRSGIRSGGEDDFDEHDSYRENHDELDLGQGISQLDEGSGLVDHESIPQDDEGRSTMDDDGITSYGGDGASIIAREAGHTTSGYFDTLGGAGSANTANTAASSVSSQKTWAIKRKISSSLGGGTGMRRSSLSKSVSKSIVL